MSNETIIVRANMRDVIRKWGPGTDTGGDPDEVVDTAEDRFFEVREISQAEAISKGFKGD
jgi:hypothetical protein